MLLSSTEKQESEKRHTEKWSSAEESYQAKLTRDKESENKTLKRKGIYWETRLREMLYL